MNTLSYPKEEQFDKETTAETIKNEDTNTDKPVKQEESPLTLPPQPMTFPAFPPKPMPWFNGMMRPPFAHPMYPMYNYGFYGPFIPGQFPTKKVFPSFHEVKPSEILPFPGYPIHPMNTFEPATTSNDPKRKKRNKAVRVSACKNYIGLLCAGFSRAILTSERTSPILKFTAELITERKDRFAEENLTVEQLVESIRVYVHQNICGKKVKKTNRERDFKVRNSEELDQLLIAQQEDTEYTCLRKEILREMINFFFDSDCYEEWLNKGMISENNRIFFLANKKEIKKKFQNPAYYKPRFNHNQDAVILL